MNVDVIRKALELARQVLWESVQPHPEFDDIRHTEDVGDADAEAMEVAEHLVGTYDDCEALVAVNRALKELPAKEGT